MTTVSCVVVVRSSMDSRIPAMPERSASGFHRPGRHFVFSTTNAKRHEVFSESRKKGRAASYQRTACEAGIGTLCVLSCVRMTGLGCATILL